MRLRNYLNGKVVVGVAIVVVLLTCVSDRAGLIAAAALLGLGGVLFLSSMAMQVTSLLKPGRRLYGKDFSVKFIASAMGFLLMSGTLIYMFVFHRISDEKGVQFSNAEYLFRSLICSLDLFMLDVDSNILDRLDNDAALKGWLSFLSILSFSCTVALLVSLIYHRIVAFMRLNFLVKVDDSKNHLYLFFGHNEPSALLVKEIAKHDDRAIVVIIDETKSEEEERDAWDRIVSLVTHKHEVFKTADKSGTYVALANQQFQDIDEEIVSRDDFDAFGYLGLQRIKSLISKLPETTGAELHVFFMGNDVEANIRNIITLSKDTTIASVAARGDIRHQIYCHARYNGPNRVIEDLALSKHLNVKLVDSSHMAVELLKADFECHPINVVNLSKKNPGTVDTPFKALIIGFGEVGRDAFRFLYEFGAFVDSENMDLRSPFECVVVDSDLEKLEGPLKASMPGIFRQRHENVEIRFETADYNSNRFFREIITDDFLKSVNYIVISIGDSDEAIALAVRIFNLTRRVRDDLSSLRIFVKCTADDKVERVVKIAYHYNFGYGEGTDNVPVIRIFGQPEKTYTYDLVISDRLIKEGKLFLEKYNIFSNEHLDWDERHRKLTEGGAQRIENLRKLRRKESQDMANALHAATKMSVLERSMELLSERNHTLTDWTSFYSCYLNGDGTANVEGSRSNIHYRGLAGDFNDLILRLAMLEHIRWNAAHELAGYEFNEEGDGCDERTMRHNCLCNWSDLDRQSDKIKDWKCDYKKFDFCVVDTTVALNKERFLSKRDSC